MFSPLKISKIAIVLAVLPLLTQEVRAAGSTALNIKQVQIGQSASVDLLLDGRISEGQIRTEYINDIIQLSLTDTNVYPAKISSVSGQELTKVFVYQYAPRLVRVRLTVKGRAEDYQGRISVRPNGKILSIAIGGSGSSDQVTSKAAQVRKKADAPSAEAAGTNDAEERALLDRILSADKPTAKAEPRKERTRLTSKPEQQPGSSMVSPIRAMVSFLGILLLMAAAFFGLRRLSSVAGKGRNGALSRLITRSLGKPAKMIEVVATHYLGPKKSIHVVRVAGRTLVLGVSDGSINLITEFQGDAQPAEALVPQTGDFLAALGEELAQESGGKPSNGAGAVSAGPAIPATSATAPRDRARDRIRSRLEGMKQL